jgi:hypothetical protein
VIEQETGISEMGHGPKIRQPRGGQGAIPDLPLGRCRRTPSALRRRDVIGNDMLFRAGQVPCRLFVRAALLRQMQGSGWRSSDPSLATRPDRA